ncbi:DnaB-like helicase C-terminal domain-containing protein [Bacterioplanoides sp.]|uniref:DnaB-like helicase C-terminal domain-containing protein n=1 Tax=Bacterioplanoides sp. TaxID=2066072 RepID=UPI003B007210
MSEESVQVQGKLPCEECGSSDAKVLYSDGHTYCHKCGAYEHGDGDGNYTPTDLSASDSRLIEGVYQDLRKRKLSEATCKRFGYTIGTLSGSSVQIANYRDKTGRIIAQHIRDRDKEFPWIGNMKGSVLFGQHLWNGGRKIVVTEGEIDALSYAEMTECRWPVVSIKSGAGGAHKDIKQCMDFLLRFELVIFMFDMDDDGQSAALRCAKMLPPKRAAIGSLPLKDINECWKEGRGRDVERAVFEAKVYQPQNIVSGEEIWRRRKSRPDQTSYPYPVFMQGMNDKTYGIRLSELDTWTSGSGMGKTQIIKELQMHFLETTHLNQALIHLEEPLEDTADHLIGMKLNKRIHLPDVESTEEEERQAFEDVFLATDDNGNKRIQLYDAFGSLDEDEISNTIRYYHHAFDVSLFWLDHLSILVSDMEGDGDERRQIDKLMHMLKELTQEMPIYIGLICHLRKPSGNRKPFEEGGVPSLDDLRGSGGIKQLSNGVYAASRNQKASDPIERNTTQLHSLKCRFTGRTGPAGYLQFNEDTGRMTEGVPPSEGEDFQDEGQDY